MALESSGAVLGPKRRERAKTFDNQWELDGFSLGERSSGSAWASPGTSLRPPERLGAISGLSGAVLEPLEGFREPSKSGGDS
eukprot:2830254-Pyramimonas_sp.AAC.1